MPGACQGQGRTLRLASSRWVSLTPARARLDARAAAIFAGLLSWTTGEGSTGGMEAWEDGNLEV